MMLISKRLIKKKIFTNNIKIKGWSKMDKNKMRQFAEEFEAHIFPTIKGKDGQGISRLQKIVEIKREEVQKRKQKRNGSF